jgi:hypothetical protein
MFALNASACATDHVKPPANDYEYDYETNLSIMRHERNPRLERTPYD